MNAFRLSEYTIGINEYRIANALLRLKQLPKNANVFWKRWDALWEVYYFQRTAGGRLREKDCPSACLLMEVIKRKEAKEEGDEGANKWETSGKETHENVCEAKCERSCSLVARQQKWDTDASGDLCRETGWLGDGRRRLKFWDEKEEDDDECRWDDHQRGEWKSLTSSRLFFVFFSWTMYNGDHHYHQLNHEWTSVTTIKSVRLFHCHIHSNIGHLIWHYYFFTAAVLCHFLLFFLSTVAIINEESKYTVKLLFLAVAQCPLCLLASTVLVSLKVKAFC